MHLINKYLVIISCVFYGKIIISDVGCEYVYDFGFVWLWSCEISWSLHTYPGNARGSKLTI